MILNRAKEISQEFLGYDKLQIAKTLRMLMIAYHWLQEMRCNGKGLWGGIRIEDETHENEGFPSPLEEREHRLERRIVMLANRIFDAPTVVFSGDPRGYCTRIYIEEDGRSRDVTCYIMMEDS